MADVLRPGYGSRDFWPVDKIFFAYAAFTTTLLVGWYSRIPGAGLLLALHAAAIALLILEVKLPNPTSWVFHNWYPVIYVSSCYKEMALFIPAIRRGDADARLAQLDFRIWHANPTVWLERIQSPGLTEFLQIAYTLFIPAVLLVSAAPVEKAALPGVPILCVF